MAGKTTERNKGLLMDDRLIQFMQRWESINKNEVSKKNPAQAYREMVHEFETELLEIKRAAINEELKTKKKEIENAAKFYQLDTLKKLIQEAEGLQVIIDHELTDIDAMMKRKLHG